MKLMEKDPLNAESIKIVKELQKSTNPEKIIDKLILKFRKNVFIREYLNQVPSKNHVPN